MTGNAIRLEEVNNRPPALLFGLSWDFMLHEETSAASVFSRAVHKLMSFVRHTPDLGESTFMQDMVKLSPDEQDAAKTLWARRDQLSNLDAGALVIAGDKVIARMTPQTPDVLDGALTNSGDAITGSAEGDDEVIALHLNLLPERVTAVAIYAQSNNHRPLGRYLNPSCHVSYVRDGQALLRRSLNNVAESGLLVGVLERRADGFYFNPVQAGYDAADPNALEALVLSQV
mgnify:CR=1 FL=1